MMLWRSNAPPQNTKSNFEFMLAAVAQNGGAPLRLPRTQGEPRRRARRLEAERRGSGSHRRRCRGSRRSWWRQAARNASGFVGPFKKKGPSALAFGSPAPPTGNPPSQAKVWSYTPEYTGQAPSRARLFSGASPARTRKGIGDHYRTKIKKIKKKK